MSVIAQRFKTLDQETNVATFDFATVDGPDVFNYPGAEQAITDATKDFLAETPPLDAAKEALDDATRSAKNAQATQTDVSKFSLKQIDTQTVLAIANNPLAQSAYKKLSDSCRTSSNKKNKVKLGKPFGSKIKCGGKNRPVGGGGCSPSKLSDVLGALTGGSFKSGLSDLKSDLESLVGLGSMGYKMNMCGAFGALSSGLDPSVVQRGAAALLMDLGSSKNLLGAMDLAGATAGLNPVMEAPGAIDNLMEDFEIPDEIPETGLADFNDGLMGSLDSLDENWDVSDYDGGTSLEALDFTDDLVDMTGAKATMTNVVDVTTPAGLDVIPDNPTTSTYVFVTAQERRDRLMFA